MPWRHLQALGPSRAEVLIEFTGEDEEPIGAGTGGVGEQLGEQGRRLRPVFSVGEVSECVCGFSDSRDNCRDPVKGREAGRRSLSEHRV